MCSQDLSSGRSESHAPVIRVGSAATQGTRQSMEDAHVAVLDLRLHPGYPSGSDTVARAFFGVSRYSRMEHELASYACWQCSP